MYFYYSLHWKPLPSFKPQFLDRKSACTLYTVAYSMFFSRLFFYSDNQKSFMRQNFCYFKHSFFRNMKKFSASKSAELSVHYAARTFCSKRKRYKPQLMRKDLLVWNYHFRNETIGNSFQYG